MTECTGRDWFDSLYKNDIPCSWSALLQSSDKCTDFYYFWDGNYHQCKEQDFNGLKLCNTNEEKCILPAGNVGEGPPTDDCDCATTHREPFIIMCGVCAFLLLLLGFAVVKLTRQ